MTLPEHPGPRSGPRGHRQAQPTRGAGRRFAASPQELCAPRPACTAPSNGHIDVLKSAGGVQGIAESILPGLVFLIAFTIHQRELTPAAHRPRWRRPPSSPWPGWSSARR